MPAPPVFHNQPQQVQTVGMTGDGGQNLPVKPLGLTQPPGPMMPIGQGKHLLGRVARATLPAHC